MPVAVVHYPSPLGGNDLTAVRASVSVSIDSTSYHFVLDTGASVTVLTPTAAHAHHLTPVPPDSYAYAGLACRITVSKYQLSSWRIGNLPIRSQIVASNPLGAGQDGLLGSSTLRQLSPIVVDYTDGELLLGP